MIFRRKKKEAVDTLHVVTDGWPKDLVNTGPAPRGKHYKHTNSKGVTYYLNMKYASLRGGELVPIYYFSKDIRKEASPLPEGFTVRENPRNGFLTVSRREEA